jgi:hypothetical protein
VYVEDVGSCAEGTSIRYFLDVRVLGTFHSRVEEPFLEEGQDLRLDYGAFLNCDNPSNANSKDCLHSCGPRRFPYHFEKDVAYVLYADVFSAVNETVSSGAGRVQSRSICNKWSELKVSSGDACSPNIREPSKADLLALECAQGG